MTPQSGSTLTKTQEFSFLAGGSFYQFLLRVGLVKPPLDRAGMRIFVWARLLRQISKLDLKTL